MHGDAVTAIEDSVNIYYILPNIPVSAGNRILPEQLWITRGMNTFHENT
jgi:hypothetical protein